MRRRDVIKGIAGSATIWPRVTRAQHTATPVIGFLHASSAARYARVIAAFERGLRETGYNSGQNVAIEYRWAEGHYDRLPELSNDLIGHQVSVIVAAPLPAAIAAKRATDTIPIVFEHGADPVQYGLVSSSIGQAVM
jgi:putative tryptophan/tyrosine transport system substrate-binding protein